MLLNEDTANNNMHLTTKTEDAEWKSKSSI